MRIVKYLCKMRFLLALHLCLLCFMLPGQSDDSWSTIAEEAYAARDFARAAAAYDSLRQAGSVSPQLFLNQGNAYFEAGDLGRAVLAYERGLRLRPGHADLKNNLAFVESKLSQRLTDLPGFFLLRWWHWLGSRLGSTFATVLALFFWWTAIAVFAIWYFRRAQLSDRRRFLLLPAAVLGLLFAIAFYALGQSRLAALQRVDQAVLVAETASLRVAPGPDATLEKNLAAGLRLRIVDTFQNNYVKVELRDGKQGWLPWSTVEVI